MLQLDPGCGCFVAQGLPDETCLLELVVFVSPEIAPMLQDFPCEVALLFAVSQRSPDSGLSCVVVQELPADAGFERL